MPGKRELPDGATNHIQVALEQRGLLDPEGKDKLQKLKGRKAF